MTGPPPIHCDINVLLPEPVIPATKIKSDRGLYGLVSWLHAQGHNLRRWNRPKEMHQAQGVLLKGPLVIHLGERLISCH